MGIKDLGSATNRIKESSFDGLTNFKSKLDGKRDWFNEG
jgi:hypothetical protein